MKLRGRMKRGPKPKEAFTLRLSAAQRSSGLSAPELADWMGGVSTPAVRTWLHGRIPSRHHLHRLEQALAYLEHAVTHSPNIGLIPLAVRQKERRLYVSKLRRRYPNV